jgi:hypothetical protein
MAKALKSAGDVVVKVASFGLIGLAGGLLSKPPLQTTGAQSEFRADPQAGIPYAMGRTMTRGNIVAEFGSGDKNNYKTFAVVLSGGGPHQAIERFEAGGEVVQFTQDQGEGATGRWRHRMWMRTSLGGQGLPALRLTSTGTKDTPGDHNGHPAEWTTAHKLSGYAHALWCLRYDTEKYPNGAPEPGWVGLWAKVYDPRKDSTYPGGSGPHRALNEATYEWSENPWLHALTWNLGRWQNGKCVLGVGAPIRLIDVAAFVEAANVAHLNNWTLGGVVYTTQGKWDPLKQMCQAGGGEPLRLGARLSCFVNMPRVSLDAVTRDDIIGSASVDGSRSRRERINRIIPRYRSEAHGWEIVAASPIVVPEHVLEDGGERTRERDYPLVQDVAQVGQLARYDIENERELPGELLLMPRFMGYEPGDCLTVTEPELGLNGQKVVILNRGFDPVSGAVTFAVRTETDAKHPFALEQTTTAPPTPALTGFDPSVVLAPGAGSFQAAAAAVTGVGGAQVPVVRITGERDDPAALDILVGYRRVGLDNLPLEEWRWEVYPGTEIRIDLRGLAPGARYEIAVRYRTVRGVDDPTTYRSLGFFLIPDLIASDIAADSPFGTQLFDLRTEVDDLVAGGLEFVTAELEGAFVKRIELEDAAYATVGNILQTVEEVKARKLATHIAGEPIGPIVAAEQVRTDTAISTLGIIGTVTEDGLAFQVDRTKFLVENGKSLATRDSEIVAQFAGEATSYLRSRPSSGQRRASLRLRP